MADSIDQNLKCVVVGDGAVGKTCLMGQFVDKKFKTEHVPTVFDNTSKFVQYKDTTVNLALWDTAGQEDYARLRPLSYPNTDVFVVCFSMVSKTSLLNVTSKWVPELVHYNRSHHADGHKLSPIVLVGNKSDLWKDPNYDAKEKVSQADIDKLIADSSGQIKGPCMMCSALTGEGVDDAFMRAIGVVLDAPKKKGGGCAIL